MLHDCLFIKLSATVIALNQTTNFAELFWLFCILKPGTCISWGIVCIALICWWFIILILWLLFLRLCRFVRNLFWLWHLLLDLSRGKFFLFWLVLPLLLRLHAHRLGLFGIKHLAVIFILEGRFFRIKQLLLGCARRLWNMLKVGSRGKSTARWLGTTVKWLITRSHSLFQKLQTALSVFVVLAAVVGGHCLLVTEAASVWHHVLGWLIVLRGSLLVLNSLHAVRKSWP